MGADVNQLAEPLRSSVAGLIDEAGGKVTLVSGRRSREQQIALRRAHCGTSDYDVFEKPSSACRPATARPGTSKHEVGLAADLGGDLNLAARLAPKYGLVRTVPSESWHYEHRDTAGRGAPQPDVEQYPVLGTATGGGGGILGALPNPISAVGNGLDALKALASFIVNPSNWLRLAGAVLGAGLVVVGLVVLGLDLTAEARAQARQLGVGESAGLATGAGAVA